VVQYLSEFADDRNFAAFLRNGRVTGKYVKVPRRMEAKEILDTMLGYLGFVAEIQEVETENGRQLQVFTAESDVLVGPEGETLEDLQYLLNRILLANDRNAPRVQVDIAHWRAMRDDKLRQRVRQVADTVRISGRPVKLEPMNSYDRRIVHDTLKDNPDVMSFSPNDDARIKRITIQRRRK
jgi:spoIIIJ-associated protein